MGALEDPFQPHTEVAWADDFASLTQRAASPTKPRPAATALPAVARLHGFDLLGQPLISQLAACPGELLSARSTVPLQRTMIGHDVVLVFEAGDLRAPIIVGVIKPQALQEGAASSPAVGATVQADDERHVIQAEREIVLRCGDASITLTRAGKVIIKGNYILSRSSGYNKIKGAAIDIN